MIQTNKICIFQKKVLKKIVSIVESKHLHNISKKCIQNLPSNFRIKITQQIGNSRQYTMNFNSKNSRKNCFQINMKNVVTKLKKNR